MVTCSAMAFVIITEEFPAAHRGWGIGIASAVGAFGVAVALLLFAADRTGCPSAGARCTRSESCRCCCCRCSAARSARRVVSRSTATQRAAEGQALSGARRLVAAAVAACCAPIRGARRASALIAAFAAAGHSVGVQLQLLLRAVRARLVAGRLHGDGDRGGSGRRSSATRSPGGWPIAAADAAPASRCCAAFRCSRWPSTRGRAGCCRWRGCRSSSRSRAATRSARALGGELFPTSYRGTSAGWLQLAESAGRSGGLFLVGAGTARAIEITSMISGVAFAALLAGFVLLALPETGTARAGGDQRGSLSAGRLQRPARPRRRRAAPPRSPWKARQLS